MFHNSIVIFFNTFPKTHFCVKIDTIPNFLVVFVHGLFIFCFTFVQTVVNEFNLIINKILKRVNFIFHFV
eukprot:00745.XXX_2285_2512_1 [CDS] Oithona nana genome sequencing.